MKEEILSYIRQHVVVTFADLALHIPGFEDRASHHCIGFLDQNIVFWACIAPSTGDAIIDLVQSDSIRFFPCKSTPYRERGVFINGPTAKRLFHTYRSERWMPLLLFVPGCRTGEVIQHELMRHAHPPQVWMRSWS